MFALLNIEMGHVSRSGASEATLTLGAVRARNTRHISSVRQALVVVVASSQPLHIHAPKRDTNVFIDALLHTNSEFTGKLGVPSLKLA